MKETYTTEEAASALGVSSARVRQLILEGVLKTERFGRAHVITREAIELARQRQTTPGPPPRSKDNDQKAGREALKRKALARWEGEGGQTTPAKKSAKKDGKK